MADLTPHTGPFDRAAAWHLLRRATFGATAGQVDELQALGLEAALDKLFEPDATLRPPVNYDDELDVNVPLGATWVRAPHMEGHNVNIKRSQTLRAWLFENFLRAGTSLERRMMLFFVNHFGAQRKWDARIVYNYYELMRGAWRRTLPEVVKDVTVDPLMLVFLDGRLSKASSPNENYARELLELFTIGKGPQVGPGDYTNYTEGDVRAIARALTGWRVRYAGSKDPEQQPESYFHAPWHDTEVKQLSARLGGATIEPGGEGEYGRVVDVIFERPQAGDYFCRKLYRWFCHHEVTPAVEASVIQPMARAFRASGYAIAAPIRLLLGSEHFFAARFRGAIVKSPLDEVIDWTAALGLEVPTALEDEYFVLRKLHQSCAEQEMELTLPTSVAGFKPYHQEPLYNRFWINAATLQLRTAYAQVGLGRGFRRAGETIAELDLLGYIAALENPSDPVALVADLAERLLPTPLSEEQLDALKGVLIPGLPDFEWTVEYNKHLDEPDDEQLRKAVLQRLYELFYAITTSAEFRLY